MISPCEPRPQARASNPKQSKAAKAVIKDVRIMHAVSTRGFNKCTIKPKFSKLDQDNRTKNAVDTVTHLNLPVISLNVHPSEREKFGYCLLAALATTCPGLYVESVEPKKGMTEKQKEKGRTRAERPQSPDQPRRSRKKTTRSSFLAKRDYSSERPTPKPSS